MAEYEQLHYFTTPVGVFVVVENKNAITKVRVVSREDVLTPEEPSALQKQAEQEIMEYFLGKRKSFTFKTSIEGTDFQKTVWEAAKQIPFGETISYGELAKVIGKPNSARAIGSALGKNPVLLAVPCHRIIGASGELMGFGAGVSMKKYLLNHENTMML